MRLLFLSNVYFRKKLINALQINAIVALENSKEQFQPVIDLISKIKAAIVMSSYRSNDN